MTKRMAPTSGWTEFWSGFALGAFTSAIVVSSLLVAVIGR
jgi:hypothetical protein